MPNVSRRGSPGRDEGPPDPLEAVAVALHAPQPPPEESESQLLGALRKLVADARRVLSDVTDPPAEAGEALEAVSRITKEAAPAMAAEARAACLEPKDVPEKIYLLRALTKDAPGALEIMRMRSYIAAATVPPGDLELAMDRAIADEQLRFASLVPEPQRLPTARVAMEHFQQRYAARYEAQHRAYWDQMAFLHARLLEARRQAGALRRLNSLTELGPPVGEAALELNEQLLADAAGCPAAGEVRAALADAPRCPVCRIGLAEEPPTARVEEVLYRLQRAIERQMSRLSSVAVQQVLQRSGDARVERFLKIVQAAQLSSLIQILDDELVGYLRRFLVEARIGALLEPILSRLQCGAGPEEDEAREVMREMARVIEASFRAAARALPEGKLVAPRRRAAASATDPPPAHR